MKDNELTDSLVESVLALVGEAGVAVMRVYHAAADDQAALGVQQKDDSSPVTRADIEANGILTRGLEKLTPHIPVVSEEDADSHRFRTPQNTFWLLDPVDGTREFINRTDEFTVNVALVDAGYPVFGVVQAPAKGQLFWGGAMGAWLLDDAGRRTIATAAFPERGASGEFLRPLRIVASRSHLNSETEGHIAPLQPQQLVNTGSSLKFCRIAQGDADYYPRLGPTCEWDTAAAQAVVEAAGGQVVTLDGHRLAYGKQDVLNPHFLVTGQAPAADAS